MAARVATDLTLHDLNPTGKEIGRGAYGRVFIYLLLLGRRKLPMRPGGDQHPKEITHTHKIYSKQLDRQ